MLDVIFGYIRRCHLSDMRRNDKNQRKQIPLKREMSRVMEAGGSPIVCCLLFLEKSLKKPSKMLRFDST